MLMVRLTVPQAGVIVVDTVPVLLEVNCSPVATTRVTVLILLPPPLQVVATMPVKAAKLVAAARG